MPEITLQLPSLKPSDKLGIFITNDFRIRKTNPGSIGEQAGFLAGDLLVSIDEQRITKGMDKLTIASTMRGDPSKVQAPKSIVVTRETPEVEDEDEDEQGWHTDPEDSHENAKKDEEGEDKNEGLVTLSVPSMPVGVRMGLSVAAGNVVRSVDPGSYAELAGFRTSDVVVSVGGVAMAGVEKLEVATRIRGDRTAITRPCKVLVRRSAANSVAVAEAAQLKLPAEESADVAAEAARAAKAPIGLIGAALEKAPVVQSQGIVDVSSAGVNVNGQFSGAVPPPSAAVASDNTVAEFDDQLPRCLALLQDIHRRFYDIADKADAAAGPLPATTLSVSRILGEMKTSILRGCVIAFSGIIPVNDPNPQHHPCWRLAASLGARVVSDITADASKSCCCEFRCGLLVHRAS